MKLKPYITFEICKALWGVPFGILYTPKKAAIDGIPALSIHILCFYIGVGLWREE